MSRLTLHLLIGALLAAAPALGANTVGRDLPVCGPASDMRAPVMPPAARADADFSLTVVIRDASTAQPMAARVGMWDGAGIAIPPSDPDAHLYHWVWIDSYFYADGSVTVPVPSGVVTVRIGCGFEFAPEEHTLSVSGDVTLEVDLERIVDMASLGWHSGDTHVHITHPPQDYVITPEQLAMVARAEDLSFVNSLEDESFFTGDLHDVSDTERLIYFSKEHANADLSHLTILGLKEWINHPACGSETSHLCGRTLNEKIINDVHAQDQQTVVIVAHPFPTFNLLDLSAWPGGGVWRGLPMDLASGNLDAMDIMSYSHALPPEGIDVYFHTLNTGARLAPSAGSDAVVCNGAARPAGGYRVYVQPDGGQLTLDGWIDAFRNGKSFVTNYPLIKRFSLSSTYVGGTRSVRRKKQIGRVEVECALPIEKIEIIGNGIVLKTLEPDTPEDAIDFNETFYIDTRYVDWVVARVTGSAGDWHVVDANGLFAQTAPIFFGSAPQEPKPQAYIDKREGAVAWLRDLVDDIDDAYGWYGMFPDSSQGAFDAALTGARQHVWALDPDPPYPFNLVEPSFVPWGYNRPVVITTTPTFCWERTWDEDPGDAFTYRLQVDESPAFASPITVDGITDTAYTLSPSPPFTDGQVYYWKVEAIDQTGLVRKSTPEVWEFEPQVTATAVGDPTPPLVWQLGPPRPNPFSSFVAVPYSVGRGGETFSLDVYDARGRHVTTLYSGTRAAGAYSVRWDSRGTDGIFVPSGTYFVRLRTESTTSTQKLVIVR